MDRTFAIIAGLLVASFVIFGAVRDKNPQPPFNSVELTRKASVPAGENIKLVSEQSPYMRTER